MKFLQNARQKGEGGIPRIRLPAASQKDQHHHHPHQ
jgi:hypothetical protein